MDATNHISSRTAYEQEQYLAKLLAEIEESRKKTIALCQELTATKREHACQQEVLDQVEQYRQNNLTAAQRIARKHFPYRPDTKLMDTTE